MSRPQFGAYQALREPRFNNPYSEMAFKYANKAFDKVGSALDTPQQQRDRNLALELAGNKQANDIAKKEYDARRQASVDQFNVDKFNATNQLNQQELAARIAHNQAVENKPSYAKEMYDLKEQTRLKDEAIQTDAMKLSTSLTKKGLSEGRNKAYSAGDIEGAKRYDIAIALQKNGIKYKPSKTSKSIFDNLVLPKNKTEKDITEIIMNASKKAEGTIYGEDNKVTDSFHIPNLPINSPEDLIKLY